MLPFDPDTSSEEKIQWLMYQLKVLEKCLSQYARAIDSGNKNKITEILDCFYHYGKIQYERSEFEFDTEYLLTQKEIFDTLREIK